MKKFISLVLFFSAFLLTSCNSIGGKDTIVARVGSENLYAEDLDFLSLQQGLGDPSSDAYKAATENLLFSLATTSMINAETKSFDSAWKAYEPVVSNRLLTIAYTRDHLIGRLGFSDNELKKYFDEHPGEFGDSVPYLQVRRNIAGRYYVLKNQDSLQRFMQEKLLEKDQPEKAELLSFIGDSVEVSRMVKKFNEGVPEDSLSGARRFVVSRGKERGVFQDSSIIRALFLADSMAVGTGKSFCIKKDTSVTYLALKLLGKTAPVQARLEDYREGFENAFVMERRESMVEETQLAMNDLGSVKIEKLVPADPHKFYEDNKDRFMTSPGFEVYHIAMKDSAVLAKTMANVKDLESFKAVAATISENEETSEKDGLVGRIKRGHALPYGIGMMPALFDELEGKPVGSISSIIRSTADSLYHSFYVSAVVPSELKSFDRVAKMIDEMYADDVRNIDLSTVLVTKDGQPIYTKADLMKIFDAEPGMPYNKSTHQNVVKMLAQAYVFGEKAREAGVDQSWEYRAMVRAARMEFIMNRYNRKLAAEQTEPPQVSENLKKFEYYYNAKKTYKDLSYEEALPKVTRNLESRARISQGLLSRMEAWNKAKVFFYDRSKASLAPVTTAEGFLAKADSLSKEQKFEEAIKAYHKVVELFSDRDSLFRTAVFSLAQAYADAQKFEEAAGCYDVFLKVWPDSPETEKALFSFGFILNENLHQDSLALAALEDFQNRFPKSELKESVDWLVENIKSGGKLADDLMKKIESEE